MRKSWIVWLLTGFLFGVLGCCGYAELTLNPLFTSKMVLQRNRPVAVYGMADAGDTVTVEFGGQKKAVAAGADGRWQVMLDPMPASSEPRKMTVSATRNSKRETRNFSDVLVGDVWLCAGQSNMASLMKNYPTLKDDIQEMDNSLVRLFKTRLEGVGSAEPSDTVVPDAALKGSWQVLCPEFAAEFSATACFFGRALQPQAGVPIGLLYANRGGTQVNMWLPLDVMEKKPEVYGRFLDKSWSEWTPRPQGNPDAIRAPSYLYNGTIHPLIRYAIRGAIWYQGESDAMFAGDYAEMIKDLITSWRNEWGYEFPFLCVQLAPYGSVAWDNSGESWAWLREAQMAALDLPKTGIAVITDAGEYKDIHPQNKPPVGERLARLAASLDDPSIAARSPMMESTRFKTGKVYITFTNADAGLEARRVVLNRNRCLPPGKDPEAFVVPADSLSGFEICGKDHHFRSAQAVLSGKDSVCVWSDEVSSPVAVRYGWANFPLCNLYNSAGLPASPFRTDSFEMPDFDALPDFAESGFEIKDPKLLTPDKFDESLFGWRKSSPELQTEQSGGRVGIYLPSGKNESLLSTDTVEPGARFRLQADLKAFVPGIWGGVAFNYISPNDYYVFRFCSGSVQAQFIHYINKSPRVLQSFKASKPFAANTEYQLEIFARSNDPYGDGAYLFKITDSAVQEDQLRGSKIDFGGGMPGGAAGCYIGMPTDRPQFVCSGMSLCKERPAAYPQLNDRFSISAGTGNVVTFKEFSESFRLTANIATPSDWTAHDKRPCLIMWHGGGWQGGSISQYAAAAEFFSGKGAVVIRPEYRMSSTFPGTTPVNSTEDALSLAAWTLMHAARLGIDTNKIVVCGSSAGGQLAAATVMSMDCDSLAPGIEKFRPAAYLLNFPALDLSRVGYAVKVINDNKKLHDASPIDHIRAGLAPMVIYQGTADSIIKMEWCRNFQERYQACGNQCTIVPFDGAKHSFYNFQPYTDRVNNRMLEFLKEIGLFSKSE